MAPDHAVSGTTHTGRDKHKDKDKTTTRGLSVSLSSWQIQRENALTELGVADDQHLGQKGDRGHLRAQQHQLERQISNEAQPTPLPLKVRRLSLFRQYAIRLCRPDGTTTRGRIGPANTPPATN